MSEFDELLTLESELLKDYWRDFQNLNENDDNNFYIEINQLGDFQNFLHNNVDIESYRNLLPENLKTIFIERRREKVIKRNIEHPSIFGIYLINRGFNIPIDF